MKKKMLCNPSPSDAAATPRRTGFLRRNLPFLVLGVLFVLCICAHFWGDDVRNDMRVLRGDRERDAILTEWIGSALGETPGYDRIDQIRWNEYDYWDYDPPFPRTLRAFDMAQDADLQELTITVNPDMPADELAEFLPCALAALSDAPVSIVREENDLKIDIVQKRGSHALTFRMTAGEPLRELDLESEIEALWDNPGGRNLLVTSAFY